MKKWGAILYFSIAAAIFAGWLYLGFTHEFTDTLGILFLALLWVFVALAMKTRLIKVPAGTPLPLTNLRVKVNSAKMLRALLMAALTMAWTGVSVWFVHKHQLDDSWYGVSLVFVPMVVFLGLFMTFLAQGFAVNTRRR